MEMSIFAAIALVIAVVIRRREAWAVRWEPTRHTWVALGTGMAAFLFSAALLLFEEGSASARLIHYVLIYVLCGFILPWGYTLLVEQDTPAAMGLSNKKWQLSLALNVGLGAFFLLVLLAEADLNSINAGVFARATFVLLVGNLFELFLYYGFIHRRLEKAFGVIPAILVTSAVYVLWHAGTQLPHEPDLLVGILKLFFVGVMYQSVFSITYNLLTIWPFFVGVGVLLDYVVNIEAMTPTSRHWPWAVLTVLLMTVSGATLAWYRRRATRHYRELRASTLRQ